MTVPPAQVWLGQCGSLHHSRFFFGGCCLRIYCMGIPETASARYTIGLVCTWRNLFYWFLRICGYAGIRVVICGDVPCTCFEVSIKTTAPSKTSNPQPSSSPNNVCARSSNIIWGDVHYSFPIRVLHVVGGSGGHPLQLLGEARKGQGTVLTQGMSSFQWFRLCPNGTSVCSAPVFVLLAFLGNAAPFPPALQPDR